MHIFDLLDNERTKIITYIVVILSESLFDGMGPVSWFKLRSLYHETRNRLDMVVISHKTEWK